MVVIRVPVSALAEEVRSRHELTEELFDAKLEGDSLLLYFRKSSPQDSTRSMNYVPVTLYLSRETSSRHRARKEEGKTLGIHQRRKRVKRNRMKTRGWQIVAKITNSKGQTAVVYKPFVDSLFGKTVTPAVQRAKVAEILRSNGNEPTDASVDYFLMNTLEYLALVNRQEGVT